MRSSAALRAQEAILKSRRCIQLEAELQAWENLSPTAVDYGNNELSCFRVGYIPHYLRNPPEDLTAGSMRTLAGASQNECMQMVLVSWLGAWKHS